MKLNLSVLLRPNVRDMKPYSSARSEFKGEASVFLDANENPYNTPYNRYPDPLQCQLKEKLAALKGVKPEQVFFGNGSDEPIDLLFRAFCEPGQDNVVAIDPSYGMYQVCAELNNVEFRKVPLTDDFDLNADWLLDRIDANTKLIFLCSPNNPTGNELNQAAMERVLSQYTGLLVIDEAYKDFSSQPSYLTRLEENPNIIVLQTFSKAWGSAGVRLGMAFADPEIIAVLTKIKYPYNINQLTQEYAMKLLDKAPQVKAWVDELLEERARLKAEFALLPLIKKVYPSDANFLLVRVEDATALYDYLAETGIIVRNRTNVTLCAGCLRITVGTPDENNALLDALRNYNA